MPFQLEDVVPWGRSAAEYCRMFDLGRLDPKTRILGCADGPASFNAEMTERSWSIISCDPIYRFTRDEIANRIEQTCEQVLRQARLNQSQFVWSALIPDVDQLAEIRRAAMRRFLEDFPSGVKAGRYVSAELPVLPFHRDQFDIALCSHFLFLYGAQRSLSFHLNAIRELLRVASEIRVFPLLRLDGTPCQHVAQVIDAVRNEGHHAAIQKVEYEFQKGSDEMLMITRNPIRSRR